MTRSPSPMPVADLASTIDAFEEELAAGRDADVALYLPDPNDPGYFAALGELARVDIEHSWAAGRGRGVADYRKRFPAEFRRPELLAAVAFEEYRQRRLRGEATTPREYRDAYGIDTAEWPAVSPGSAALYATRRPPLTGGDVGTEVVPASDLTPPPADTSNLSIALGWNRTHDTFALPTDALPQNDSAVWQKPASGGSSGLNMVGDLGRSDPESVYRWLRTDKSLPEPGSDFLGFQLVSELGRGAFGRVYLARQGELNGREVALKVACNILAESQTLAQLQHTNIVPIYSFHQAGPHAAGSLQAVCMPYFGRTTLARVVQRLDGQANLPSSGRELRSTIAARHASTVVIANSAIGSVTAGPPTLPLPLPTAQPDETAVADGWARLEKLSFVDAVLSIGEQLADGLAHAHARGILHRDLKPANVLLTDEGRPMLLDFNLAEDTKLRGSAEGAAMGGTLPYMSPEQLRSFQNDARPLDGRSDVYSLGVMLYELLTGRHPYPTPAATGREALARMLADRQTVPPVRTLNPAVSPATESIVRRCLAFDAADRYQSAADLREDLQRQLSSRPLKFAAEPSGRERLAKWTRRHPRMTSTWAVAATALVCVTLAGTAAGRAWDRNRDLKAQALSLEHGTAMRDAELNAVRPEQPPEHYRRTAASLLALLDQYGVPRSGENDAWQERPEVRRLAPAQREKLTEDVGVTFYLLADAARRAGGTLPAEVAAWRAAAERYAGGRLPLALAAQRAAFDGGDGPKPDALAGSGPRDQALYAAWLVEKRRYADAFRVTEAATRGDGKSLAAWYLSGLAYLGAGDPDRAAICFGACIALKDDFAPAWLNRGVAHTRTRTGYDLAVRDFTRAVELAPNDPQAYVERAVAHEGAGHPAEAVADLTRAIHAGGADPQTLLRRAKLRFALKDEAGAKADLAEAFGLPCVDAVNWAAHAEVRLLQANAAAGQAGDSAVPAAVREAMLGDLEHALALDADHPVALQNKASLLSEMGRDAEALNALNRLIAVQPRSAEALAGRSVTLARAGKRAEAVRDAEAALLADPRPLIRYQVAGAYAHSAKANLDDRFEALSLLASALRANFGLSLVDGDPDLDPIRDDPEFKRLLAKARALPPAP